MEALQYFDARYHPWLGEESPSKGCKAAYKKVKWTLSNEKTKVQELQGKLQRNTDRLNLLTALALRYVSSPAADIGGFSFLFV
jgi:hypothetical protein